ncbi:uncharacterized protein LOC135369092 [Ornithodoros turicata]|uniref:uncharacterized protein LOC135369092 n=1 Tax=Ornithodoros turicata TaxID=34597 RepID=UPI003139AA26
MRVLKLPKETPVVQSTVKDLMHPGTLIYRLKGSDGDSDELTFGANNAIGRQLLDFQQVLFNSADVLLKQPLTEEEYTISIFVTDGVETTEVESTILVTNGTGLPHPFVDYTTLLRVPENTKINSSIGYVTAKERDHSNLPVTFELRGSEKFKIRYEFGPRGTSKAVIQLIGSLDYETKNLYQLDVIALNAWTDERYDTRNIATLPIAVVAEDVPDTPPRFDDVPPVVTVSDSAQAGTSVVNLTATDGDFGSPRNLSFRLDKDSPWSGHFSINPQTGEVKIARPIAELSDKYGGTAVYLLKVTARETTSTLEYPAMEASTQFAVVLMSKENHPPTFGSDRFVGFINEHSPHLTAVSWAPGTVAKVYDRDQGRNNTFRLYLEEDDEVFSVHPNSGSREADFAILVRDSSRLDYETAFPKYIDFKLIAAETEAVVPLTTTVEVRVNIVDVNDHPPLFTKDTYDVTLAEDAKQGSFVAKVTATDPDTGLFGKVKYTSLNGPLARNLKLDVESGEITLATAHGLDRETTSDHVLTVEAHDEDGRGQRALAKLHVHLEDANDNAPVFGQSRYDAVLAADLADFTEPVILKAVDADSPGPNSNVTYEIVSGNYEQKFRVDPISGALTLTAPLTMPKNGLHSILLTVRAHDQGIPVRSAAVQVHVHTQEYLNRSIVVLLPGKESDVMQRRGEIEKGLSEMLGAKVNIYSMQPFNQSNEATMVRAWAIYESQPIDLKSFSKIMNNIYGKEYAERQERSSSEVKKSVISDRLLWILIIVFILIIIILLLIMLCCCWRYILSPITQKYLRVSDLVQAAKWPLQRAADFATATRAVWTARQRPTEGAHAPPLLPHTLKVPHSLCTFSCTAFVPVLNGPSSKLREDATQTGRDIKSIAIGTTASKDDTSDPGTDESPRGRSAALPSEDRQFLLHEMRRADGTDGDAKHIGNYLVVRRDVKRRRPQDPGHQRPPTGDSLSGISRHYELSGDGPRRTEILYIRSPPPEETDLEDNSRTAEGNAATQRDRAHRRENARRVRFSRYHKVDDGSFALPLSSDTVIGDLPRDQVWVVPQERPGVRHKENNVAADIVRYEEPCRRRPQVGVRLHTVDDVREDAGSDGEMRVYEELDMRSKNRLANDPPKALECEAGGPNDMNDKEMESSTGKQAHNNTSFSTCVKSTEQSNVTQHTKDHNSVMTEPPQHEVQSSLSMGMDQETTVSGNQASSETKVPQPETLGTQSDLPKQAEGAQQPSVTILTVPYHQVSCHAPAQTLQGAPSANLPNSVLTPTRGIYDTPQNPQVLLPSSLPATILQSYGTSLGQQPSSFVIINSPAHAPQIIVSQPYVVPSSQAVPVATAASSAQLLSQNAAVCHDSHQVLTSGTEIHTTGATSTTTTHHSPIIHASPIADERQNSRASNLPSDVARTLESDVKLKGVCTTNGVSDTQHVEPQSRARQSVDTNLSLQTPTAISPVSPTSCLHLPAPAHAVQENTHDSTTVVPGACMNDESPSEIDIEGMHTKDTGVSLDYASVKAANNTIHTNNVPELATESLHLNLKKNTTSNLQTSDAHVRSSPPHRLHAHAPTTNPGHDSLSLSGSPQKRANLTQTSHKTLQAISSIQVSTTTNDNTIDVVQETMQTGILSDSEFDVIERDLKTSLTKYVDSDHDDSDSGIGPTANCLRLKNNVFIEKKSLFTIAYDAVSTHKLRTSLQSTPSP